MAEDVIAGHCAGLEHRQRAGQSSGMGSLGDLIGTVAVVIGLLGVCVGGYFLALRGLRPKQLRVREQPRKERETVPPKTPGRELTATELGLSELGSNSALSPEEQRRLKMEEQVRNFSQIKPEDAAELVRRWLRG